ncbi:MAG: DUF1566 domain-containing protein, partial [Burkholderiales bacterium]|nr:DUF1566 domain-containing protein [Burkholderiales bacterium]
NGAILTSGDVPLLNTVQATSGQMLVYNAGNESATLGTIIGANGVTILQTGANACINSSILTSLSSCIVYFTVPQADNTGTITIPYDSTNLTQNVTWYNGKGAALLQMYATPNNVSFATGESSELITITAVNIGGYNLSNMSIPTAANVDGGSASIVNTPTLNCVDSNNNNTGSDLPINGTCTYAIKLQDSVVEDNRNMLLKIRGGYINSSGAKIYERVTGVGYTAIQPIITISSLEGNNSESMMGLIPITFTASINAGSSTLSATLASVAGTIISNPSPCALSSSESCTFTIIPWYTGFDTSTVGIANYDPFIPANTAISLSATGNAIITGSGVTNNAINYKITTPYIYLPAPLEGSGSESNNGITWGVGGAKNPRFTVGGDCVVDNLTGLMWAKNANLFGESMPFANAAESVESMNTASGNIAYNLCGYSDWRAPSVNELISLVNYGENTNLSTWLISQGFANVQADRYWSSTIRDLTSSSDNNFMINFSTGLGTSRVRTDDGYIWPVRGNAGDSHANMAYIAKTQAGTDESAGVGKTWPTPRFAVGTGTESNCITDNLTGLMWAKNWTIGFNRNPIIFTSSNPALNAVTYSNAKSYIIKLNESADNLLCGYSDWRMPTIVELMSVGTNYAYRNTEIWLEANGFTNVQATGSNPVITSYWSSTPYDASNQWVLSTRFMYVSRNSISMSAVSLVPVRGGQ